MANGETYSEYQSAVNDAERKRKADFTKAKNEVAVIKAQYMAAKAVYMTRLAEINAQYEQSKKDAWSKVDHIRFMQEGADTNY
jgi:hypothetical protein